MAAVVVVVAVFSCSKFQTVEARTATQPLSIAKNALSALRRQFRVSVSSTCRRGLFRRSMRDDRAVCVRASTSAANLVHV